MITASTPTHREINSSGVLAWTDREDVVNRITQFPRPENGPLEIASETVQTTNSEARWTEMMNGREELVELVRLFLDVLVLLFLVSRHVRKLTFRWSAVFSSRVSRGRASHELHFRATDISREKIRQLRISNVCLELNGFASLELMGGISSTEPE